MKKIIMLTVGMLATGSVFADGFNPEPTYQQSCSVCHETGIAGAPKRGDKAAWDAKIEAAGSKEAMIASGLKGKGAMPARGAAAVSDEDFATVVEYMMQ